MEPFLQQSDIGLGKREQGPGVFPLSPRAGQSDSLGTP